MKTISTIIFSILIISSSFGQGKGRGMENGRSHGNNKGMGNKNISSEDLAKKQTERLSSKINLTTEQFAKVYQLKLTRIQAFRTAKESKNNQLKKDANQNYKEGMKQVLTVEQKEILKKLAKEHKEKKRKKEDNNDPKGNSDKTKKDTKSTIEKEDHQDESEDNEPDFNL